MHRRELLLAAGTAATAGIAGCVLGDSGETGPREIELVARADGWGGVAPPAIEGGTNPTLPLVAGRDHLLRWTNGDGAMHDVRVVTADGELVLGSDVAWERGQTVTVAFTASREMAEYYCAYHSGSMRGSVRVAGETPSETPG